MLNMSYRRWMQEVDKIVMEICDMSMAELPDWLSRDTYNEGLTPREGAEICLEEAGYGKVSSVPYEEYERLHDEP